MTFRVHHTLQLIMLTFALCSMFAFLSTSKLTTSCLPWKQASVKAVFRLVSIYSNNFQYQKMNDYHVIIKCSRIHVMTKVDSEHLPAH